MAALSELVKCMGLLKIVSLRPSTIAVTVTVKGEPTIALEGALISRFALGEPQPNATNPATAALNTHTSRVASTFPGPRRADLPENLAWKRTKPASPLDSRSSPVPMRQKTDMAVSDNPLAHHKRKSRGVHTLSVGLRKGPDVTVSLV